tara:strand:+ start:607 stop:906 length:300 start_codon:yes stop_codon:yes gene_type:complete
MSDHYNGRLVTDNKYNITDRGTYSSKCSNMFETMISYFPGGLNEAYEAWKSPQFEKVREIDQKLRDRYRQNYSGGGSYTFHHLSRDEIKIFDSCISTKL